MCLRISGMCIAPAIRQICFLLLCSTRAQICAVEYHEICGSNFRLTSFLRGEYALLNRRRKKHKKITAKTHFFTLLYQYLSHIIIFRYFQKNNPFATKLQTDLCNFALERLKHAPASADVRYLSSARCKARCHSEKSRVRCWRSVNI